MNSDIEEFECTLRSSGLHAALGWLNARAAHRFTGVYRFDGDWLRNVALFDRWNPQETTGADAPMGETFCALVPAEGESLEVLDGSADPRFPWMAANAVASYCGVLIRDEAGAPFGTLCHFDLQRSEAASSQLPLFHQAAPLIHSVVRNGSAGTPGSRVALAAPAAGIGGPVNGLFMADAEKILDVSS